MKAFVLLSLVVCISLGPSSLAAQTISYDFDGDGRVETASVIFGHSVDDTDEGAKSIGLRIDRPGQASVFAPNLGIQGNGSGPVILRVSQWGSLVLQTQTSSGDDTFGTLRDAITIAYAQKNYRVIVWSTTMIGARAGGDPIRCGMDLKTGRATVQRGNGAVQQFRGPISNLPITRWKRPMLPQQCWTV